MPPLHAPPLPALPLLLLGLLTLTPPQITLAQYRPETGKYEMAHEAGIDILAEELQSHASVKEFFYPEKLFENIDVYRTESPLSQDFTIAIMINPCGDYTQLPYDCCANRFGDGEYGLLTDETVSEGWMDGYKTKGEGGRAQPC